MPSRPVHRLPLLKSRLQLLATVGLLPVLAFSAVLGMRVFEHQEATLREGVLARNRMLVAAIDARIEGRLSVLRALATSDALARGDLAAFQAESERVRASQPDWRNLLLIDEGGQQLTNLRIAASRAATNVLPHENPEQVDVVQAVAHGVRPFHVGSLGRGPLSAAPGIPLLVPTRVHGVPAVLKLILEPESLSSLVQAQHYPDTWALALVDANARLIARVPRRPLGDSVSADLQAAMKRSPDGWYRGRTLEGVDTLSGYARSPLTGWTVAAAVPIDEVRATAWQAAGLMAAGAILSLALSLGAAFWLARHVSRPIAQLAGNARRLADGDPPEAWPDAREAQVDEVLQMSRALEAAAQAVGEREALMTREQSALVAADRAKDEFLAMLGHELRNPLGAITASAHVLRLSRPDAHAAHAAHQVIERQARQMTRLVEDLMDISRLAMRKVTLQVEPVELAALVARIARTWGDAAPSRANRLELALEPVWVDGDRARIEQVVSNLLDNAEKFSHGQGRIGVHVRAAGEWAVLEVSDEGQGIAADDLHRIFEPFVQGPQSFDRPQGGIGLGLALVQQLVVLHGGTVAARSGGADKGASFGVRLPSRLAPVAPAARTAHSVSGPSRRILLVEDNEDGRQIMEAMLGLEGHVVRSAADGRAALAIAAQWAPDVVLLDIGLPDMDGYEVGRRLRAMPWTAPPKLVALSGYGQPDDQRRAYEAGFDLHLTKPVTPEFLRDVLAALTARQA